MVWPENNDINLWKLDSLTRIVQKHILCSNMTLLNNNELAAFFLLSNCCKVYSENYLENVIATNDYK